MTSFTVSNEQGLCSLARALIGKTGKSVIRLDGSKIIELFCARPEQAIMEL